MRRPLQVALAITALVFAFSADAQQTQKRIALVIGNGAYQAEALPTSANDAGLIAQTLQAAGFDVVGARDLDQDTLRRTFRDFLDKASASGPDTVAFVYLSGYGVQLEGENYFVPVDAKIARDTDVPVEALRMSDYTRPLAALKLKANIIVLDAARVNPFAKSGQPLASGLTLTEPGKEMLVAFNAAPGTVAPQEKGPYSAYAQALAEMIRTGGLPVGQVFDQVRLRVNEVTKGGEVPWSASKIDAPFVFFDRGPDAPPPPISHEQVSSIRSKPIRDFDAQDAYVAALERDTLQGYLDFLAAYPRDPMTSRVRAIVAARREAITWRRTYNVDTPQAYWSYLRRYPRGPHVADARRRLAYLSAAFDPPPSFALITYEVPPPPEEEVVYFRRPVLVFDDPDYGFIPPPPPPVFFLAPPPPEFVILAPPPPAYGIYVLPVPDFVPVPAYYNPPAYVAPPPQNIIYNNIHNTVVINNTSNTVTITNPSGQAQTVTPAQALAPQNALSTNQPASAVTPATTPGGQATPSRTPAVSLGAAAVVGAAAGAALLAPSLPPSVAKKATLIQTQNSQAKPAAKGSAGAPTPGATSLSPAQQPAASQSGQPGKPLQGGKPAAQSLPGSGGQPLPQINGKTFVPGGAQSPQTQTPATAQSAPLAKPAQLDNKPAAQSLPGGAGGQPLPQINGKPAASSQAQPPQSKPAQPASPTVQPAKPSQPSARKLPTAPPAVKPSMPSHPAVQTASPPAASRGPLPTAARPVPPPVAARPAPPPPRAVRPAPSPAAVARPAPQPAATRAPPPVARPAPPPLVAARPAPPPPPAARPARPPAAVAKPKPCVLPNGQACPEKK